MSRIFSLSLSLLWLMVCASAVLGQPQLTGANPPACGMKLQITKADLNEANDGMIVNVEWKFEQTAPEIKIQNFSVFARVKLGIDNVENTISLPASARSATIKLSRRLEFDFKDVEVLTTEVKALAQALPSIPVTNIISRKVIEDGRDSAVEVTWGDPGPLPCSANFFEVSVAAKNEKGDRLTGRATPAISKRSARVDLSGDINKKGLHDPEATIKVINNLIEVRDIKTTSSPILAVPRDNSGQTKVTVKEITFQATGDRVDPTVTWEVVEPAGFKATGFNLKFESENAAGQIGTLTKSAAGGARSALGRQVVAADLRSLTVTITATFKDNANTIVLTREDKKTQTFNIKSTLPIAEPAKPGTIGLSIGPIKVEKSQGGFIVTIGHPVNPSAGVTITSFDVEARAIGFSTSGRRTVVTAGTSPLTKINFTFDEVGFQIRQVDAKVVANARRADGSTFQQTVTGSQQFDVQPPPPLAPTADVKVSSLNSSTSGNNFLINGGWIIVLVSGVTVENFVVEAAILKSSGPIRKTAKVGSNETQKSFEFTQTEATGRTGIEYKVTANLRRADGTTFQEVSTRQGK